MYNKCRCFGNLCEPYYKFGALLLQCLHDAGDLSTPLTGSNCLHHSWSLRLPSGVPVACMRCCCTAEQGYDSLAGLASRVRRGGTDLGVQEAACRAVPHHGLHAVCACQPLNGLSQQHAFTRLQEDVHFALLHGTLAACAATALQHPVMVGQMVKLVFASIMLCP